MLFNNDHECIFGFPRKLLSFLSLNCREEHRCDGIAMFGCYKNRLSVDSIEFECELVNNECFLEATGNT